MIAILKNSLAVLSDSQIIKRLDALVWKEREMALEVLRHIIEFDRRKLYLCIGYGSLYDYCTLHLGYSGSAAMRRIHTTRAIMDFPEIYRMLEKNELNLISVCMLAGILYAENKTELLREARCKSTRQIEEIVARYKPGKDMKDRVRTVFVKSAPEAAMNASTSNPGNLGNAIAQVAVSHVNDSTQQNGGKSATGAGGKNSAADPTLRPCSPGSAQPRTTILKKKYKLEFTVDPDFMKKLDEAKSIMSHKYPAGISFETLFEEMLDEYLEKHSPKRKKRRREERRVKKEAKNEVHSGK